MFNSVNSPELVLAIGRVLREAADERQPHDDYQRSQFLSAYSIARHLAAEQLSGPALHAWFRSAVVECVETGPEDEELDVASRRAASALSGSVDSAEVGAALCDLLAELRARDGPEAARIRRRIQGVLREFSNREVAALSDPPK